VRARDEISDIGAPDLPQPRELIRTVCGEHLRDLVISDAFACPGLPRFAVFLLGFPEAIVPHGARSAGAWPPRIKFSCLNWNLMVPKLHPLTVAFDGNSAQADNVSSFVRNGDGYVTT
jgi:hypothetical protein